MAKPPRTGFPDGKRFAFTIIDDTDDSRPENIGQIYALLTRLGLRITKTVWPLDCPEGSRIYWNADTLQNREYLELVRRIASDGHEIASHCATMESSERARTESGLRAIENLLGVRPGLHANHGQNRENIYWGAARYRTLLARSINAAIRLARPELACEGHVPGSPYFWGDLCRERFRYVRNFAFTRLDISSVPPARPYRLPDTPFVNFWFSTADAPDVEHFKRLVNVRSLDELAENGGFTIISTHLGKGFVRNGVIDADVEKALQHVSRLGGWCVPASTLLDHLLAGHEAGKISRTELLRLELMHLSDRIRGVIGLGQS